MNLVRKNKAILLLFAVLVLIGTSFLWPYSDNGNRSLTVLYGVFLCAGGYALAQNRRWLVCYLIVSVLAVIFRLTPGVPLFHSVMHSICVLIAQAMLIGSVIRHSFFNPQVLKTDRILAGVAGYLLLGLLWSNLFMLLNTTAPGALVNQATNAPLTHADELYFGFVTLTTLGYGDIIPATPLAKVTTIFTALTGVLYLAVFIAAILSKEREATNH